MIDEPGNKPDALTAGSEAANVQDGGKTKSKIGGHEQKSKDGKKSKDSNHKRKEKPQNQPPPPPPLPLLPWDEPPLVDMDAYAAANSLYPHCIVTMYQIVRDLYIKQEVVSIQLIDGKMWQRDEYFIQGISRATGLKRLMVPFYLDADIDLPWLLKLATACKSEQTEVYLCVHTPETIM